MISFKQFLQETSKSFSWRDGQPSTQWVKDHMNSLGYKVLGTGHDKAAYLDKSNNVIVIIGPYSESRSIRKDMFLEWAEFCNARKSNPYLVDIIDYSEFEDPEGRSFLQVKMERLFSLRDSFGKELEVLLDDLQEIIRRNPKNLDEIQNAMAMYLDVSDNDAYPKKPGFAVHAVLQHIPDFKLFVKTMVEVIWVGRSKGYIIDLHDQNYMLSSDGTLVIVDPWFQS